MDCPDQAAEVVRRHLAEDLVPHRGVGLAEQVIAELPLHHGHRALRVRPEVVVRIERLLLQRKGVIQAAERVVALGIGVYLEGNVRRGAVGGDEFEDGLG